MASTNWRQEGHGAQRRQQVLDAIERYIDEQGYSPTRQDIAKELDVSEDTIKRAVRKLIEEGRLEEGAGPRTFRIPL